jgi:hypothetical protein
MKNETANENKTEFHVNPVALSLYIIHSAQKSRRVKLEPKSIAAGWLAAKRHESARKGRQIPPLGAAVA